MPLPQPAFITQKHKLEAIRSAPALIGGNVLDLLLLGVDASEDARSTGRHILVCTSPGDGYTARR
jgi:hypothetical protein